MNKTKLEELRQLIKEISRLNNLQMSALNKFDNFFASLDVNDKDKTIYNAVDEADIVLYNHTMELGTAIGKLIGVTSFESELKFPLKKVKNSNEKKNNKRIVYLDIVKLFDIDFKFFVVLGDENFKSYIDLSNNAVYLKFKIEKFEVCFSALKNDFNNIILPILFKMKNIVTLDNYSLMIDCFAECCVAWGILSKSLSDFYRICILNTPLVTK